MFDFKSISLVQCAAHHDARRFRRSKCILIRGFNFISMLLKEICRWRQSNKCDHVDRQLFFDPFKIMSTKRISRRRNIIVLSRLCLAWWSSSMRPNEWKKKNVRERFNALIFILFITRYLFLVCCHFTLFSLISSHFILSPSNTFELRLPCCIVCRWYRFGSLECISLLICRCRRW